MNAELLEDVRRLAVCDAGPRWVQRQKTDDPNELWRRCERADWMIWLLYRLGILIKSDADSLSDWLGHTRRDGGMYPWCYAGTRSASGADKLRELWPDFPL